MRYSWIRRRRGTIFVNETQSIRQRQHSLGVVRRTPVITPDLLYADVSLISVIYYADLRIFSPPPRA